MPNPVARLDDMPLQYLENLLTLNPEVLTFPALEFPLDAAASGVTIPNPTQVTGLNTTSTLQGGGAIKGGAYLANIPVVTRAQILAAYQAKCDKNNVGKPTPFAVPDPSTTSLSGSLTAAPLTAPQKTPANSIGVTQASNPGLAKSPALQTDILIQEGVLIAPPAYKPNIQVTQDVVNSA